MKHFIFVLLFLFAIVSGQDAFAVDDGKYASLVINARDGKIIHSINATKERHPASLTKIAALYVIFDHLSQKKISLNDKVVFSSYAASQPRSNLGLKACDSITMKEAIMAMIIRSANDVAVAVAEKIAGSEAKFVELMNKKARSLGMNQTVFYNAHGLPHPKQITTAHDMALLALALQRNHPKYYHLFSKTSFTFRNTVIKTHNRVLSSYKWADGLKTGYINASGFNIVTTAKNNLSHRLVVVVMGGETAAKRDSHTIALLDSAFKAVSSSGGRKLS